MFSQLHVGDFPSRALGLGGTSERGAGNDGGILL